MILVSDAVPSSIHRALRKQYQLAVSRNMASAGGFAIDRHDALEIRALVTPGSSRITRSVMRALPRLGLIACIGSGFDGIDLLAAAERGIQVTHSPGAPASSVADVAVALLIASQRQLVASAALLKTSSCDQRWPATRGLTGMRAGIYGFGAIGRRIAARLAACEMEIGYFSRTSDPDSPHAAFASLLSLAEWADSLIVAVPATAQTVRSVDPAVLRALGPQGHLVNVARASVVDTDALCAALAKQEIAGAALDVVAAEDLGRLLACPSVLVTPHVGGSTHQAESLMRDYVLSNLAAFLAGQPLPNPVRRENPP